jgi:hypothetical protein
MTVGKYPGPWHKYHTPRSARAITPFSRKDYDPADFRTRSVRMREDPNALTVIETSFGHIRGNLDHPVAEA